MSQPRHRSFNSSIFVLQTLAEGCPVLLRQIFRPTSPNTNTKAFQKVRISALLKSGVDLAPLCSGHASSHSLPSLPSLHYLHSLHSLDGKPLEHNQRTSNHTSPHHNSYNQKLRWIIKPRARYTTTLLPTAHYNNPQHIAKGRKSRTTVYYGMNSLKPPSSVTNQAPESLFQKASI